jgi:hypothetical protein
MRSGVGSQTPLPVLALASCPAGSLRAHFFAAAADTLFFPTRAFALSKHNKIINQNNTLISATL